ncbi:MAG: PAS domain-containing sensor histidine kinase [Coriobacteriia bacterium]
MNPEILVGAADTIAFIAFSVALALALTMPMKQLGPQYERVVRAFLAIALSVYVLVSFSNVLEHAGITAVLDDYEDYVEILFVPFLAYVVYVASIAFQVREISRAERLVRSEHELLTTIVDTSPGGIMLMSSAGEITFASDTARDVLELIRPDERATWRLPPDLECTLPVPGRSPLDVEILAAGATLSDVLCVVTLKGEKRALSVSASPLKDGTGAVLGSVVTFVDMTDREQARQDLLEAQSRYSLDLERTVDERTAELLDLNAELTHANMAKRDLLANVSHELRTPLNVIIGFTDVLAGGLAGPLTSEQAKQLKMVKESSVQLLGMVNDLLDIERIEAGYAVVMPESVDVKEVIGRLVDMMQPLAAQRAIELTIAAPDDLRVMTDPQLMLQVVRNLVSNALKFTPPYGHVSVEITATNDTFSVTVTDDGIGIAEEDHQRVFEAFKQVHGEPGRKPQGTGLGLAICKDVTAVLGGTITLTSQAGEGATFVVTLPRESQLTSM